MNVHLPRKVSRVSRLSRERVSSTAAFSTATDGKLENLMRRLHEKLFSDGSEKGKSTSNDDDRKEDDKEKRKDERMIERLANDSIMILKKAVGKRLDGECFGRKALN